MLKQRKGDNKKVFPKRYDEIPDEYRNNLNRELMKVNISREIILASMFIILDILLLIFNIYGRNFTQIKQYAARSSPFVLAQILLILLVYLSLCHIIKVLSSKNIERAKNLHVLIILLIIIALAAVSLESNIINPYRFIYAIAALCVASLILLNPFERFMDYFLPYLLNIIYTVFKFGLTYSSITDILFYTFVTILVFIISSANYSLYYRNFVFYNIILNRSHELDNIIKTAGDKMEKCSQGFNETEGYENLRTAFFTNISHELRTPLTVIFSAEQMLDMMLDDNYIMNNRREMKKYIDVIKHNCYRLTRLINNFLDITRIDAGSFEINYKNCDIVKVVEDMTLAVANNIECMGFELVFDTETEEKTIACDPDKIQRVILNLLSNAVKFTPNGGHIYVYLCEKYGNICISVKDTGIGIPDSMKDHIFERFVQVDKTITRDREGSGIGLSIVKSLIDMHNGKISLISEEGKGSEFIIEIPDKVLPGTGDAAGYNTDMDMKKTEMINMEFSDIYC